MKKTIDIPPLYYPLWLLLKGLAALPLAVLYLFADFLYFLLYYVVGYRRKVVLQNLRSSFPEKSEAEVQTIAKAFYRQFADVIVEILHTAGMRKEEMRQRVQFTNPEMLANLVNSGTPVLILGSHVANWEWALSAAAVTFNFPAEGVYKRLNNPFFESFMLHTRSRLGARLIEIKQTSRDFIRNRHVPRVVALLSDQTPLPHETDFWTNFLCQDTGFYVGAEKLQRMFGYPVLFLDVKRVKRGHYNLTFEPISNETIVPETSLGYFPLTQAFAEKLDAAIRRAPADYLWTHKRW
ncbi:MAG TPA: lysophospholipid acyltransferase family protein, partial [Pontibacter sp.]